MADKRILAVSIDNALFDKLDEFVDKENITKQKYVAELITKDLKQRMAQEQNKTINIKETDAQKIWDRTEVINAIDDFIILNGKIPKQTEFRNENGLPSYGAAGRILEESPAEYMKIRFDEIMNDQTEEQDMEITM